MKGQHLAVQTIITFLMGITLALGVISLFDQYREGLVESVQEDEISIAASRTEQAIFNLKNSDEGQVEKNLPEDIGGTDYTVLLSEEIEIIMFGENHSRNNQYSGSFTGSADSETISVFKTNGEYTLRNN